MSVARQISAAVAIDNSSEFAPYAGNPDFVLSLARGLRVIESFESHHEGRSMVEIARSTGLSRAAIRRILHTLELLGYVERSRQVYRLKTQVLRLGFSFLSSSSVIEAARPILEHISEQLHESSCQDVNLVKRRLVFEMSVLSRRGNFLKLAETDPSFP